MSGWYDYHRLLSPPREGKVSSPGRWGTDTQSPPHPARQSQRRRLTPYSGAARQQWPSLWPTPPAPPLLVRLMARAPDSLHGVRQIKNSLRLFNDVVCAARQPWPSLWPTPPSLPLLPCPMARASKSCRTRPELIDLVLSTTVHRVYPQSVLALCIIFTDSAIA